MPKKTKKEKLLARQHRMKEIRAAAPSGNPPAVENAQPATYSYTLPKSAPRAISQVTLPEYAFIKRDLYKTVLLTAFILISEILLARILPR